MLTNVEDIYPLSPMQEGMLFHSLLAEGAGIYFDQMSCRMEGSFNAASFHQAWLQVMERHAILRSCFLWEAVRRPVQVVMKQAAPIWNYQDWSHEESAQAESRWHEYLHHDRARSFDLKKAPLMRFAVVKASPSTHYFCWSYHHILLDGWCHRILLEEVSAIYRALDEGAPLKLDPAPRYKDYIGWLAQQSEEAAEKFWRQELKGLRGPTPFGCEHTEVRSTGAAELAEANLELPAEETRLYNDVCRELKITLNTLMQGAWAVMLHRYSGEQHICFGAIVSGRSAPVRGIDRMLGLFINTLPVHVAINEDRRVDDYLQHLQHRQLTARSFEHSALVKMQAWSEVPRSGPLFDHILIFDKVAASADDRARSQAMFQVSGIDAFEKTNYKLELKISAGSTVRFLCKYDQQVFQAPAIGQLLVHLRRVLEQMVARPASTIAELSLLDATDQRKLLGAGKGSPSQCDANLPALFARQASQTPDNIALRFAGQSLTYRDLNLRANQLAHYLGKRGVEPETRVGVCLERGFALTTAMLAILKAGAVYVPIDPANPRIRLDHIVQQAKLTVLVTDSTLASRVAVHSGTVIQIDREWDTVAVEEMANPAVKLDAANLAYIIFTSGSTGKPKGVMGTHGATVNRLLWMREQYPIDANEVCCQKTSIGFVDSIAEMLTPLLAGSSTVVIPDTEARDARALIRVLAAEKVSRIVLVPSLLSSLLGMLPDQQDPLPALKLWVSSGETLTPQLRDQFLSRFPQSTLLNLYGSSEVAADATWTDTRSEINRSVSIGKPIAGMHAYLLDEEMRLLPHGVEGELHVGGTGLARGYLHAPALTAERFIPDPFGGDRGDRLYRTGDRVYWQNEGNLVFVGRRDRQVKVRGYRVEMDEIEAALAIHDAVDEAAVVAYCDEQGEQRVVAYLVSADRAHKLTGQEMRQYLDGLLPPQMVPSLFQFLPALPRTSSGKTDRMLLPKPDWKQEAGAQDHPRSELELQVALLWEEFLSMPHVGRTQNFFDLGGHSISALSLLHKAKNRFAVEIALGAFFENPTVAGMAELLKGTTQRGRLQPIVPLHRTGTRRPLFLVHATGGGPLDYLPLSRLLDAEQPLFAFQANDNEEASQEPFLSLESRATQYIEALRSVQPDGPYLLGGWSFGAYAAYEMACQLADRGEEVAGLILMDIPGETPHDLPHYDGDAEFLVDFANLQMVAPGEAPVADKKGITLAGCPAQSDRERVEYLTRQLVRQGILPTEMEASQVKTFAAACRKREQSLCAYRFRPYWGDIDLICAADGSLAWEDAARNASDATRGFAKLCLGKVRTHIVPGNHLTMLAQANRQKLAEVMQSILTAVEKNTIPRVASHQQEESTLLVSGPVA